MKFGHVYSYSLYITFTYISDSNCYPRDSNLAFLEGSYSLYITFTYITDSCCPRDSNLDFLEGSSSL